MIFGHRRGREDGWLAISVQASALTFAHGARKSGKWIITRGGTRTLDNEHADIERTGKQLDWQRYRCLTILPPADYQLLLVEAPSVPAAEMKSAVRWRVKDMIDYRVDEATVEVLDIPPQGAGRAHSMFAIAARNETIRSCIDRFEGARIPLSVIDIPETAQRNVAALFEVPDRSLAFVYAGAAHTLLTVTYRGELYLARRIEVTMDQLLGQSEEVRSRLLLELQRSFDHFDRQFPSLGVAKLMLGPEPQDTGLAAYLARNMDLPVESAQLESVLDFSPQCPQDPESLWRLFPVLGAALRTNGENGKNGKHKGA